SSSSTRSCGATRTGWPATATARSRRSASPLRPDVHRGRGPAAGSPGRRGGFGSRRGTPPMTATQSDKAIRFPALHEGPGAFVIPTPGDAGSARALAALGFQALATSSGAAAGVLGRRDGKVARDEALAQARAIVAATDLPVSADLEKGFGDAPSAAAETIRLAAGVGLVGGSIEDATGDKDRPLYDIGLATERVAAAAQAARALPFPFTLTARAENFLR